MNQGVSISIKDKYSHEIDNIEYLLSSIKNKKFSELYGAQSDGAIAGKVDQLRRMIYDLLEKIQLGKPSDMGFWEDLSKSEKKSSLSEPTD